MVGSKTIISTRFAADLRVRKPEAPLDPADRCISVIVQ